MDDEHATGDDGHGPKRAVALVVLVLAVVGVLLYLQKPNNGGLSDYDEWQKQVEELKPVYSKDNPRLSYDEWQEQVKDLRPRATTTEQ